MRNFKKASALAALTVAAVYLAPSCEEERPSKSRISSGEAPAPESDPKLATRTIDVKEGDDTEKRVIKVLEGIFSGANQNAEHELVDVEAGTGLQLDARLVRELMATSGEKFNVDPVNVSLENMDGVARLVLSEVQCTGGTSFDVEVPVSLDPRTTTLGIMPNSNWVLDSDDYSPTGNTRLKAPLYIAWNLKEICDAR